MAGLGSRIIEAGLPALRLKAGNQEWEVGNGEPTVTVTADPFDLQRSLFGRRRGKRDRDAVAGEDGSGALVQGSIERSNVDMSSEMIELLMVQRAYAANAQIVQAADQLMSIANGLRR